MRIGVVSFSFFLFLALYFCPLSEKACFLLLQLYLDQFLSRSHCSCQCCVCLCCDVCCAAASVPDAPLLHPSLLRLSLLPIPPLRLRKPGVLSPSLTVRLMFGPWCRFHFARGIASLFSSLSPHRPRHFSQEAVFTGGITAISGFIFVYMLSCATIERVTFLSDSVVKCSCWRSLPFIYEFI